MGVISVAVTMGIEQVVHLVTMASQNTVLRPAWGSRKEGRNGEICMGKTVYIHVHVHDIGSTYMYVEGLEVVRTDRGIC